MMENGLYEIEEYCKIVPLKLFEAFNAYKTEQNENKTFTLQQFTQCIWKRTGIKTCQVGKQHVSMSIFPQNGDNFIYKHLKGKKFIQSKYIIKNYSLVYYYYQYQCFKIF